MTRVEIISRINDTLVGEFELNQEQITPDTSVADLGLDSLDYFDMIIILESEFNFKLKDRSLIEKIVTVGDIYDLIENATKDNEVIN